MRLLVASVSPAKEVMKMKKIVIGVVGAGMGACLEVDALIKTYGVPYELRTVMAHRPEQVVPFQEKYGFANAVYDYDELLADPEINVVCICTPPYTHEDMILKALDAGKHVICEKPLIGYFGKETDETPVGQKVSKAEMYREVCRGIERIREKLKETGLKLMYADNAVYAPAIQKSAEIIRAKKSRILYMKGEESLKGSSSPLANEWSKTGGGTFIRNGTHPLTAILWLKQQEAMARNVTLYPESLIADMGMVTPSLDEYEHRHIDSRPHDVEDSGTAVITFNDGSKATVIATNTYLGGLRDYVEVYCNDATLNCKLTLSDAMQMYFLDEDGIENMPLSYLLSKKIGWNNTFVSDDVLRGYCNEMQDFLEAVYYDREPKAGIDLAADVMRVIYAAYRSAEEGRRINLGSENIE